MENERQLRRCAAIKSTLSGYDFDYSLLHGLFVFTLIALCSRDASYDFHKDVRFILLFYSLVEEGILVMWRFEEYNFMYFLG